MRPCIPRLLIRVGCSYPNEEVVALGYGRKEAKYGSGLEPLFVLYALKHAQGVVEQTGGGFAYNFVLQEVGVAAVQLPGLKEGGPIDVLGEFVEVDLPQDMNAGLVGLRGGVGLPVEG